jgi:hypothetical protein
MATPLVNCVMLFTACLPVFVNHRHHTAANCIANLPCYSVSAKFKPRAETIDRVVEPASPTECSKVLHWLGPDQRTPLARGHIHRTEGPDICRYELNTGA